MDGQVASQGCALPSPVGECSASEKVKIPCLWPCKARRRKKVAVPLRRGHVVRTRPCRRKRRRAQQGACRTSVGSQINRRLAGCDVGRCQETGGRSSTWGFLSVSSITTDETQIAEEAASAGTGGTRPTSLLCSPWLQWAVQTVESLESPGWWQSGSPVAVTVISANAMAASEHPG